MKISGVNMLKGEKFARLNSVGYRNTSLGKPTVESVLVHPEEKFQVSIRFDGSVCIFYKVHPVHWCWDGYKFIDRVMEG
jgi:hypothetical protein